MPYPGRGHINTLMSFCKLLASKSDNIIVTFVITEEWFGFIGSDPKPAKFHFRTIPNVVPSELNRAQDISSFLEAVFTKLEAPFEQLLDQLGWLELVKEGISRWPLFGLSLLRFSRVLFILICLLAITIFQLTHQRGSEVIDYIPGVSDLPSSLRGSNIPMLKRILEVLSVSSKANYLIFSSGLELELQVIDALRRKIQIPIFPVGSFTPYSSDNTDTELGYLQWLDGQPSKSVLYISMGSYISFSRAQMDEIAAGLRISGVRYLWVAHGETSQLKDKCGEKGLVVPWCDQLRVLTHSSVGGFWSHCGWNSTMEGVFAGVPFLALPVRIDQLTNSKVIVEDWKVGWRVLKKEAGENVLAERDEYAELIQRFMDLESGRGIKMRRRARELQKLCQQAIAEGGSSQANIENFVRAIWPAV